MPDTGIPVEAQSLIRQFEAEEARRASQRALEKPRKFNPKENLGPARKNVTASEMMKHAKEAGCEIVSGGKHGVHIKGPDGREISLPVHGGNHTLATGTAIAIDRWLQRYREMEAASPALNHSPVLGKGK